MSFFDYLDNLRQRSMKERRKLAFYLALTLTVFIALFWLVNLAIVSSVEEPGKETRIGREFKKIQTGSQVIVDGLKSIFKN